MISRFIFEHAIDVLFPLETCNSHGSQRHPNSNAKPQMLVMFNPWHPLLGVPQTDLNFGIFWPQKPGEIIDFAVTCGGPPESLRATSGGAGAASCVHQDRVASDFRA